MKFRLGFVVNPYAGVGGPLALKGSDTVELETLTQKNSSDSNASKRGLIFLERLSDADDHLELLSLDGPMGGDLLNRAGLEYETIGLQVETLSSAKDTQSAVYELCERKIDLLIFVGGDGTARDVCLMVPKSQVVLGVPAGVKMHSGVFAITPEAAACIVLMLVKGSLNSLSFAEVRDINEDAFRKGIVKSQYYGEMCVPDEVRFIQQVKQGGIEVEELVAMDIADHIKEMIEDDDLLIFGPGSTSLKVLSHWSVTGTLLGVDAIKNGELLLQDATAQQLLELAERSAAKTYIIVTAIGAQGHIIGRGNQQLSPKLLRLVGRSNLIVIATKSKLQTLSGRPLNIDSGDAQLNNLWSGYIGVLTGYRDQVYYPLGILEGLDDVRQPEG